MRMTLTTLLCLALAAACGCSDSDKSDGKNASSGRQSAASGGDASGAPTELDRKMYGEAAPPAGAGDMVLAYTPPADWQVTANPTSGVLSVASRPLGEGEQFPANMTLMQGSVLLLSDKTLEGWATRSIEQFKRYNEGAEVVSSETVTLSDGTKAKEVVLTCDEYSSIDGPFKVKMWLVLGYRNACNLTAIDRADTWAQREEAINAAATTLRWEPAPQDGVDEE